jgi:hypothetical protein
LSSKNTTTSTKTSNTELGNNNKIVSSDIFRAKSEIQKLNSLAPLTLASKLKPLKNETQYNDTIQYNNMTQYGEKGPGKSVVYPSPEPLPRIFYPQPLPSYGGGIHGADGGGYGPGGGYSPDKGGYGSGGYSGSRGQAGGPNGGYGSHENPNIGYEIYRS